MDFWPVRDFEHGLEADSLLTRCVSLASSLRAHSHVTDRVDVVEVESQLIVCDDNFTLTYLDLKRGLDLASVEVVISVLKQLK